MEFQMTSQFNAPESKKRRSYLRKNMTTVEKLLWSKLRKSQLNGLRFRRQYCVLSYVVDFYCPEYRLGIEILGDVHGKTTRRKFDLKRKQEIESLGVTLLSYTNMQVTDEMEGVLTDILFNLPPTPSFMRGNPHPMNILKE